jgi:general nucleoside transport system permease protein
VGEQIYISLLATAVAAATPIMLAALGELVIERVGLINLGVEGMMLIAALVAFAVGVNFGNSWIGIAIATFVLIIVGIGFGWLTIELKCDQVVSGLAFNILAAGLTSFLGRPYIGVAPEQVLGNVPIPFLSAVPVIGVIFLNQSIMTYVSFLLVPVIWFVLFKTRTGLNLRAVGESADAADAAGIAVNAYRFGAVGVGAAIIGLAGADISTAVTPTWTDNLVGGRGWIALALVIVGGWKPQRVLGGALLFGFVESLSYHAQALNIPISVYILQALPYAFTVLVLVIGANRAREAQPPAMLGISWSRE